jgi:hypothetical protein
MRPSSVRLFDQLAVTDLIVNGVLERHERLPIGIVELSAVGCRST